MPKTGTVTLQMAGTPGGPSRPERYCSVEGSFIGHGKVDAHIADHTGKGDTVTTTLPPQDR